MLDIQKMVVHRGHGHRAHRVSLPSLQLDDGQCKAITGPSGCGKSTLLEAIGLLLAPQRVERFSISQPAQDVALLLRQKDEARLAGLRAGKIGFVLQSGGLLPYLNVAQNVALPRRQLGLAPHSERIAHAYDRLGLNPLLDKLPAALSIGERQRVAFVRAMAHEPDLLLADEPTAALDPHTARGLFELFMQVVKETRLAALVVSHDWALIDDFQVPRLHANSQPGETTFEPQD